MAPKYPAPFNVRFTDEDMKQLDQLSQKLDMPRSALIRRAWREWFKTVEKTAR